MDFETYERVAWAKYDDFAHAVSLILEAVIRTHPALRLQTVTHRAKATDSLRKKLEENNLLKTNHLEDNIKDLAGCRVIFYTNTDVNRFFKSNVMHDNFEIIEAKIHHPSRYTETNNALYIANHYLVKLRPERVELPEYARFVGMRCEVQIQTILNHAWAETAHDITYKKPPLGGFGGTALEGIDRRLEKVMRKYLIQAGYELQKIADDFERLRLGKELFDEGALETIIRSENNNERFEALERLAENVLPYYDDLESRWPEIATTLTEGIKSARKTPAMPIETPFGNLSSTTPAHITNSVVSILKTYRYLDVDRTFDVLCELFPGADTEDERKPLLSLAKSLAKHELEVWRQYGPAVQGILVSKIKGLPSEALDPLQPLLVVMLGEILDTEVTGTSSTSNAVSWSRGVIAPSGELADIRLQAINLLTQLYSIARTEVDQRNVLGVLANATRLPHMGRYSHELVRIVLEDARRVTDFYAEIAPSLSYESLQTLEKRVLQQYRNGSSLPNDMEKIPLLTEARDKLLASIRAFRDCVNSDRSFVIYKTLVGFESVFPPAWENDQFDCNEAKAYREERVAELIEEVDEATSEEWFAIVTRCAQTQSSDRATFPTFAGFLRRLGETMPDILIGYLDRMDQNVARFLPAMLNGLMNSSRRDYVSAKVDQWLGLGQYLSDIAWYLRSSAPFDERLLRRVFDRALALGDDDAILNALLAAADQHKINPGTLIEGVFLPALAGLASKGDLRWVRPSWFSWLGNSLLAALNGNQATAVLKALVPYPKIEYSAEEIVATLARRWPERVIDFLGERQRFTKTNGASERYSALPFSVHELREPLASASSILILAARRWFGEDGDCFRFRGAHLLAAVFPDFSDDFREQLTTLVQTGDRSDIKLVLAVLHNYLGNPCINDLCKEIVASLDEKDNLRTEVIAVLSNCGMTSGEFGVAEAFVQKKSQIEGWLNDPRENVRTFAEEYIHALKQWIADECRSAEESIARRKLNYGEEVGED